MHSLDVTHALIQTQHKEPSFCFNISPVGYKQRLFNLIQFWGSAVHCEGMLKAHSNSQSSSRFLFLCSSCVRFKSGGRSVGGGRTVCGLCVHVWDGLKSREEEIFFAPFQFCSSLTLHAQQNELNLFIPCPFHRWWKMMINMPENYAPFFSEYVYLRERRSF